MDNFIGNIEDTMWRVKEIEDMMNLSVREYEGNELASL
jgi:hypothetical protein